MEFNYNLPVNLIFGRGRVKEIGKIVKPYGERVLIVTGGMSTKKSGLLNRVIHYFVEEGIESFVFDQVTQNPLTTTAKEGTQMAIQNQCDVIVGIGGGSIMDCAKAIAFMIMNPEDISEYIFNRRVSEDALPIVLVPTTCGTGSEGNGFAVLTNPETGDKKSLRCQAIVPKASIIDSELMETMPKEILASVGFDAFCHCMEAYISKLAQPLTDLICIEGMKMIDQHLIPLYEGKNTPEAWDCVSYASTIGRMAINTAGVTLAHGMEHPVSGLRNVVHGRGLAALTPVIMEASIQGNPQKFGMISRCLGGENETDCVNKIRDFLSRLGLTTNLGKLGIKKDDVEWLADNCMKVSAAGILYHPIQFLKEDIKALYEKAI